MLAVFVARHLAGRRTRASRSWSPQRGAGQPDLRPAHPVLHDPAAGDRLPPRQLRPPDHPPAAAVRLRVDRRRGRPVDAPADPGRAHLLLGAGAHHPGADHAGAQPWTSRTRSSSPTGACTCSSSGPPSSSPGASDSIPPGATTRRTVAITSAWAVTVFCFNVAVGTNYGFLNRKPATSILDLLGPWPLYVVVEIALVAGVWALMTWPWERSRADRRGARECRGITPRVRRLHPVTHPDDPWEPAP